jgi:hypothetical protein
MMADERQKRLMQEALDKRLSPEAYEQLRQQLDMDAESSAQFDNLKKLDAMLRSAPFERAPQRLALSILAKIAEMARQRPLSTISALALALGLALVTLVTLPLLVAAVTLFLGAVGSAAALSAVIHQIVNLLALVVAMLEAIVQGAQSVLANYPQAPALMLAVVPIILFWLMRVTRRKDSEK